MYIRIWPFPLRLSLLLSLYLLPFKNREDVKNTVSIMSYFRRNEGTIVFALASLAFIAFYCINYCFRRCRNRDVALAAGDTEEAVLSPIRPPRGLDANGVQSIPSFIYTEANGIGTWRASMCGLSERIQRGRNAASNTTLRTCFSCWLCGHMVLLSLHVSYLSC